MSGMGCEWAGPLPVVPVFLCDLSPPAELEGIPELPDVPIGPELDDPIGPGPLVEESIPNGGKLSGGVCCIPWLPCMGGIID